LEEESQRQEVTGMLMGEKKEVRRQMKATTVYFLAD
jgi:hypothetical protein